MVDLKYKKLKNNLIIGHYFGFPSCCIEEYTYKPMRFIDRDEKIQKASINGFVPCPNCAKKILSGEIKHTDLISDRYCPIDFKNELMSDEEKNNITITMSMIPLVANDIIEKYNLVGNYCETSLYETIKWWFYLNNIKWEELKLKDTSIRMMK